MLFMGGGHNFATPGIVVPNSPRVAAGRVVATFNLDQGWIHNNNYESIPGQIVRYCWVFHGWTVAWDRPCTREGGEQQGTAHRERPLLAT